MVTGVPCEAATASAWLIVANGQLAEPLPRPSLPLEAFTTSWPAWGAGHAQAPFTQLTPPGQAVGADQERQPPAPAWQYSAELPAHCTWPALQPFWQTQLPPAQTCPDEQFENDWRKQPFCGSSVQVATWVPLAQVEPAWLQGFAQLQLPDWQIWPLPQALLFGALLYGPTQDGLAPQVRLPT